MIMARQRQKVFSRAEISDWHISQAPPEQIAAIVVISFHGFGGEKN